VAIQGDGKVRTSRFAAMVRQRCPRCLNGRVYRGLLTMNERCPTCGYVFEREQGYFTGAMYTSYLLALPTVFGIFLVLWAFSTKTLFAVEILVVVTAVLYLPLVPLVFRYSRVLWMYFDWRYGPDRRRRR
jgi:uncharacterized protein (DUF983 family)